MLDTQLPAAAVAPEVVDLRVHGFQVLHRIGPEAQDVATASWRRGVAGKWQPWLWDLGTEHHWTMPSSWAYFEMVHSQMKNQSTGCL